MPILRFTIQYSITRRMPLLVCTRSPFDAAYKLSFPFAYARSAPRRHGRENLTNLGLPLVPFCTTWSPEQHYTVCGKAIILLNTLQDRSASRPVSTFGLFIMACLRGFSVGSCTGFKLASSRDRDHERVKPWIRSDVLGLKM